ncbi:HAD-IA family hydrolase [Cellulomonas shaoxiangyii]|uniref:HAD-IA family hydrolase n=1 Tax=Cellulomonas shaoxiangyii TaxID=2566013 RepID=UPI00140C4CC2|nr:HAD-IA family hydrolase [Cellulomonas shaoxiangyii]
MDGSLVTWTCRALLLDVDGTLVDSAESVRAAWSAVAQELGADAGTVAAAALARRATEVAEEFFAPEDRAHALDASLRASVGTAHLVRALPGAADLLGSLPDGAWGCVTSGRREILTARLRGAGLPVPAVFVTAEDVECGKPHPQPYLRGAELVGVDPVDAVALEDTPDGVRSARAAGLRVVGVLGTHAPDDLRAAGADVLVDAPGRVRVTADGDVLRLTVHGASTRSPAGR